jgi:hypothetical protein
MIARVITRPKINEDKGLRFLGVPSGKVIADFLSLIISFLMKTQPDLELFD